MKWRHIEMAQNAQVVGEHVRQARLQLDVDKECNCNYRMTAHVTNAVA